MKRGRINVMNQENWIFGRVKICLKWKKTVSICWY